METAAVPCRKCRLNSLALESFSARPELADRAREAIGKLADR